MRLPLIYRQICATVMGSTLTLDGQLSADRRYIVLRPDIRFVVDPEFYRAQGFGELGLMPKDLSFC